MESRTPLDVQKIVRTFHSRVIANLPDFGDVADIEYWNSHPEELCRLLGNLHRTKQTAGDWLERILDAENAAHQAFFGGTFDLAFFQRMLEHHGEEHVREWMRLGMEPHFLPEVVFTPESDFPGWKVKPNDWYWQQLAVGKLKRRNDEGQLVTVKDARLEGAVVLIDTRLKPKYQDGRQIFANDKKFMGEIISDLREKGLIKRYEYGPQSNRFGVSADEWQEHIRSKVAEKLKLVDQVRLELVIETNVIPQLYQMPRVKDGTTDTWVWYEEFFGVLARRLYGGRLDYGGLAYVVWNFSSIHWASGRFVLWEFWRSLSPWTLSPRSGRNQDPWCVSRGSKIFARLCAKNPAPFIFLKIFAINILELTLVSRLRLGDKLIPKNSLSALGGDSRRKVGMLPNKIQPREQSQSSEYG